MHQMTITFGKYKNRHLDVLLADTSYCQWLVKQAWFEAKNLELYAKVLEASQNATASLEQTSLQSSKNFLLSIALKEEKIEDWEVFPFNLMHKLIRQGSQFIICTHSPILLSYPSATIYQIEESGLVERDYEETDTFKTTQHYLNHYHTILYDGVLNVIQSLVPNPRRKTQSHYGYTHPP